MCTKPPKRTTSHQNANALLVGATISFLGCSCACELGIANDALKTQP